MFIDLRTEEAFDSMNVDSRSATCVDSKIRQVRLCVCAMLVYLQRKTRSCYVADGTIAFTLGTSMTHSRNMQQGPPAVALHYTLYNILR